MATGNSNEVDDDKEGWVMNDGNDKASDY